MKSRIKETDSFTLHEGSKQPKIKATFELTDQLGWHQLEPFGHGPRSMQEESELTTATGKTHLLNIVQSQPAKNGQTTIERDRLRDGHRPHSSDWQDKRREGRKRDDD
jgi:hypothetical protein